MALGQKPNSSPAGAAPTSAPAAPGPFVEREKRVVRKLVRLAGERAEAERSADAALNKAQKQAATTRDDATAAAEAQHKAHLEVMDRQYQQTRQSITSRYEELHGALERESQETLEAEQAAVDSLEKKTQQALHDAVWLARNVYDAARKQAKEHLDELQQQIKARVYATQSLQHTCAELLTKLDQHKVLEASLALNHDEAMVSDAELANPNAHDDGELPDEALTDDAPQDVPHEDAAADEHTETTESSIEPAEAVAEQQPPLEKLSPQESLMQEFMVAETQLRRLYDLQLARFISGLGPLWVVLGVAAVVVPTIGYLTGFRPMLWLPPALLLTAVAGAGLTYWLRTLARKHVEAEYFPLVAAVHRAQEAGKLALREATIKHERHKSALKRHRQTETRRAERLHKPVLKSCRLRREKEIPRMAADFDNQLFALTRQYDEDLPNAENHYQLQQAKARLQRDRALEGATEAWQHTDRAAQAEYNQQRDEYLARWQIKTAELGAEMADIRRQAEAVCSPWPQLIAGNWHPATGTPPVLCFGQMRLALESHVPAELAQHLPAEVRTLKLDLPALVDFPSHASLCVKAQDAGRRRAVELLQAVMMRMLTSMPPGKVRFTIVDAVGLGQNFAAFMHLADYEEALVGHRIWTEPVHVEQRLADLTEHMETVIQKYLRDEFPTIEAYNREAGEIAEPLRVLVVANFPAGFSDAAARRLLSIIASGPRCGVHVLMSVDSRMPMPAGIRMADLQQHATLFSTEGDQIVWQDPDFKHLPLTIDAPPMEQAKPLLQAVGEQTLLSKRVEVPFTAIAPTEERYWTFDSRNGIDVPLGRAGATRLQHLRLGQGTSQHVLIAGKTGSGKSTLLHALITNAALRYGPDDLELYLIDFKKGVEFKTYVTHSLPHARLVAIESEREFGLSVMQRLDAEMKIRGDTFREQGVQDIASFRAAGGVLPRILFIVDEFQEFFVQDDRLAQDAALLLDRLVRQGRAFGIHVHLGSQTLGGAYTLARSTLGQMAVRIALECSEADDHLILSEDNSAARLLSRPGEAIYNDANGLVEGNHPFQVVWLPDERREVYLRKLDQMAETRLGAARKPMIVFEGSQPADMERSLALESLLANAKPLAPNVAPRAWLGEPLAIEDATSVEFIRRAAANMLLLGQNEEAAAGMFVSAILSLAAQTQPASGEAQPAASEGAASENTAELPEFTCLMGASGNQPFMAALERLPQLMPGRVRMTSAQTTANTVREMAEEIARRQAAVSPQPPLFLFIFDISRLRELRRQEDEFSFSRGEPAKVRPDQHLATILRDGPEVGVHTIIWCDTLTSFNRSLGRQALKDFETRVLMQMSPSDSSLLIDTPAASQLQLHRALVHREDAGRLEKFRPFSVPSAKWLQAAAARIAPVTDSSASPAVAPAP